MRLVLATLSLFSVGALAAGCASGGSGTLDVGRRDAPLSLPDVPLGDVGVRPDVPVVTLDGGVDAPSGLPDVPVMTPDGGPPPECTSSGACDDGDACNGVERCELGRCVAGTPITCDDGVACTVDSCSGGTCSFAPSDGLCGGGQRCTSTGCTSTSTGCSPITQSGCGGGQSCSIFGSSGSYTTMCTGPVGSGVQDDYCLDSTDCAAGYECLDDGWGDTLCLHWCNAGTGAGCSGVFYSCYGFVDPLIVGGVEYGVCVFDL